MPLPDDELSADEESPSDDDELNEESVDDVLSEDEDELLLSLPLILAERDDSSAPCPLSPLLLLGAFFSGGGRHSCAGDVNRPWPRSGGAEAEDGWGRLDHGDSDRRYVILHDF